MKKIVLLVLLIGIFTSCSKEEEEYCNSHCWEVVEIDTENTHSEWNVSRNRYILTYYVVNECSGERNQFKTFEISNTYRSQLGQIIKVNSTYCAFANENIFTKLYK